MKRIIAGTALVVVALGSTPAFAARCGAEVCLSSAIRALSFTDLCEDTSSDCDRYCAPFEDDPIICFP